MADANLFPDEAGFTPRPAWQVIEAARRQYLTGELTLQTTPATRIYLRDGQVYFAERASDGALPIRLMMEGVITRDQMQRGTVIVNGVEHVGRMFEADPTIDRASVELCTELFTDDVMVNVADATVDGYELALYRRHPSGIDRWYPHSVPVAGRQGEAQPASRPATRVAEAAPAPAPATTPAPKAAAAKPKAKADAQAKPAQTASAQTASSQTRPAAQATPAKAELKNNLNAPPITQAVPVTVAVAGAAAAVPPPPITQAVPVTPPPITQTVPVTPPPTTQVPLTMPAPTAQIPVTQRAASAELDATAIADEVAEAIKRAFAGTGAGR